MSDSLSLPLEISHDQIDPLILEAVRKIDEVARKHETDYFLAGATAREVIHGQETPKGVRFNLSLTHEEITQVVGVTRETVTRALTELRTKSLISTKGPTVLIRNKPALEAMVVA